MGHNSPLVVDGIRVKDCPQVLPSRLLNCYALLHKSINTDVLLCSGTSSIVHSGYRQGVSPADE
jgi:hypothetical protein